MVRSILALLVTFAAVPALAGGYGIKPGLWETRMVKQIVDGKDMSSQMAAMASQMQQMMANMPPEQRAKIETMMKERGGPKMTGNGGVKICITPEQANSDRPFVDHEGRCEPSKINRSGNHVAFEMRCTTNGNQITSKGESIIMGDVVTSSVDMTTKEGTGQTHLTHHESEMKYLGSDCGDVRPIQSPKASRPSP